MAYALMKVRKQEDFRNTIVVKTSLGLEVLNLIIGHTLLTGSAFSVRQPNSHTQNSKGTSVTAANASFQKPEN